MRTRTGPAWATARRILPSCGTWHSTSCRRMARRKRCAASFSGPDGTMPISPASLLYSEVQLPWEGSAFVAIPGVDLNEILCVQEDRQVDKDNTVVFARLRLQIPPSPLRPHFVKARVRVRRYANGSHAIFHRPRCLGRYDAAGVLQEQTQQVA